MQKISSWKIILTTIITLVSFAFFVPNIAEHEYDFLPDKKINLGLDLKGGSHLLLDVDFESYLTDITQSLADQIKKALRDSKIGYMNVKIAQNLVSFDIRKEEDYATISKVIKQIEPDIKIGRNGNRITLAYSEYTLNNLQDKVIDQSIEIIRMRVDSMGTTEPTLQRQGSTHILLQVPGEENPSELKKILGKTAKMTFHLVDEKASRAGLTRGAVRPGSFMIENEDGTKLILRKRIIASGDQLINAQATFNQDSVPVVSFAFNTVGAKAFADATTNNVGSRLAIVLDGKVLSAPSINVPIRGGSGIITGNFTVDSANELAMLLKAGALPAPLKIVEERTVGPNLGADSINNGIKAAKIGFTLVVIFMFLTYGILGIFANITLMLALIYIAAMLTVLQATLTLPGIAGIILTIGMAVDANVLIYERIKEEVKKGCSNNYAVKLGFESAFATIFDSNITTLIAAFLLYSFGVGAIKGFAVTLTIGIVASMYTALVVTKLMIDIWLKYYKPKSLGL